MNVLQRRVVSNWNRHWHSKCTRSASLHQLSLALNGYSGHQLKVTKGTLLKGIAPATNLTCDESLLLLSESARHFDPLQFCRATLLTDYSTQFPVAVTAEIITSIKKSGTKEDLKNFRSLLCTDDYSYKFEFDAKTIQAAIDQCVKWDTPSEALQWLMFAQDRLQLVPTNRSFNIILSASVMTRSWDILYYLVSEMDRNDVYVSAVMREELIEQAALAPVAHWRYTRYSLAKTGAVRVPSRAAAAVPAVAVASKLKPKHHLGPASLATALWTLARAGELGVLRELYRTMSTELVEWKALGTPATTLPLFSSEVLEPLVFAAVELHDPAFLRQVLSNNYEEAMSARLPEHLLGLASQQESSAASLNQSQSQSQEEFSRWLESFVLLVLDAEPLQMQAGRQIGAAVSWLLSTNQSDVAAHVWNHHLSSLRELSLRSLDDEAERMRAATDATITVISSVCSQSQSAVLLPATARFLRSILVPIDPEVEVEVATVVPLPVEVSASSMGLVRALLDVFARAQDAEAAALVLSASLKQGLLVSEDAMTTSLQLLQKQGDHRLTLELYDLYLNIADLRAPNAPRISGEGADVSASARKRNGTSTTFAPHIFSAAVRSFANVSKLEGILHLLNTELPSRGFIPRRGLVAQAIQELLNNGAYEEGVGVYQQAQKLYSDLGRRNAKGLRSLAAGYGVSQLLLVDLALRCCAKGKFGLDALEIFSSLEDAQSKGLVTVRAGQFAPLVESVIEALATPDFLKIVPQFLQSLGGLIRSIVVTREALLLSLAAAVSVGDEEVVLEVARIMRQDHGLEYGSVDAKEFLTLLRERFSYTEEQAALKLLADCNIALAE